MAIFEGDVLLRRDDQRRYRVVHRLSKRKAPNRPPTHAVVIDMGDNKAVPVLWNLSKTQNELAEGLVVRVEDKPKPVNLKNVSDAEHNLIERRWALMQQIRAFGPKIFDRRARGQFASKLATQKVASKPFFYSTFRQYLQGNNSKQSLATRFANCGAPKIDRIPVEGDAKPGRHRLNKPGRGLVLTEIHRRRMYQAFTKAPTGLNGRNLKTAYYWMLVKYYFDDIRLLPNKEPDPPVDVMTADAPGTSGVPKYEIVNPDHVPTFEVFRYHYNKQVNARERLLKRIGKRRFDLTNKPQVTGTLTEVDGIGSRYYIDATVLDVWAVSRFKRDRIVGRPTLYLVVDQYSRMIVGLYVGLEPPCWVGALLALYNCSVDKVGFCAAYGIEIEPNEWPVGGIPRHLMGDRGEHIAIANDALVEGFNLEIDTARPYAGDAKGVGERAFGVIQAVYGPFMPGYVAKDADFGSTPPSLKADLDIVQITGMMIRSALDANLRTVVGYEETPEQVAAGIPSQPLALWHWCLAEYRHAHRHYDLNYLKRYLWARTPLKTSRKMLRFCTGLYFQGEALKDQDWFFEALRSKQPFDALYHPLHLDSMLVLPGTREGEFLATPTPRSSKLAVYSHSELMSLRRQSAQNNAAAEYAALMQRAQLQAEALDIVQAAKKTAREQKAAAEPTSDAQRIRETKRNRTEEVAAMTAEAFGMTEAGPQPPTGSPAGMSEDPLHDELLSALHELGSAHSADASEPSPSVSTT